MGAKGGKMWVQRADFQHEKKNKKYDGLMNRGLEK